MLRKLHYTREFALLEADTYTYARETRVVWDGIDFCCETSIMVLVAHVHLSTWTENGKIKY